MGALTRVLMAKATPPAKMTDQRKDMERRPAACTMGSGLRVTVRG